MRALSLLLGVTFALFTVLGCTQKTIQEGGVVPGPDSDSGVQEEGVPAKSSAEEFKTGVSEQQGKEGIKIDRAGAGKPVLNIDEEKETRSIYTVIEELESCYSMYDYAQWLSLLTMSYRQHFNDREILEAEGWAATNIREFFDLLVQTRRGRNIGDLDISRVEFINDNKAYVYVLLDDEEFPVPQHTFIRVGDSWLKGLSNEGE